MVDSNVMADMVGPFYDMKRAAALLGISQHELRLMAVQAQALQVETADGDVLYPTFQFDGGGQVRAELLPVLQVFGDSVGSRPWTVAVWLRTPLSELRDRTPDEALRGPGSEDVQLLAHRWASVLAT